MRPARRRAISVFTTLLAALAVAAVPALSASAQSSQASLTSSRETPRVEVRDSQPSWATSSAEVGQAPAAKTVNARVFLGPRSESALDAAVAAVSTPGSAAYQHYITPEQFRDKYGPTPDAAAKVSKWLRNAGLKVSGLQQNGRYFVVSGSVKSAQKAFGTKLSMFRRGNGTYQAPAQPVTVPGDVGPYILTVTGLDEAPAIATTNTKKDVLPSQSQTLRKEKPSDFPLGLRDAQPCDSYWGESTATADRGVKLPIFQTRALYWNVCGYRPAQLRSAYGVPAGLTGKGVTVAVIDAYQSPTLVSDANHFAVDGGDPTFAPGQFTVLGPPRPFYDQAACDSVNTWYPEQAIDVEAVHALAPGANVLYEAAASCNGIDLLESEVQVVDDNRASIVSVSYGDVEANETTGQVLFDTYLFKQAALQGIGFYIATGDNGDNEFVTGQKQVGSSASNPFATAVGGTSLAVGYHGQYKWETGWGTNLWSLSVNGKQWVDPEFHGGGGGGNSVLFGEPSYQSGVVPSVSPIGRGVPDVAMDADPNTGMLLGLTQQFPNGVAYDEARVGGTSLSAPLFAAVQALTSQAQHVRLGFANPRIYALARQQYSGTSTQPAAFRDVTNEHDGAATVRPDFINGIDASNGITYSVRSYDDDTSLATTQGWDDVTGVGSPSPDYYFATGR
jgi:subtilase family serine protease